MQRKEHDAHIIEATATQNADTTLWTVRVVVSWEQGTDISFQPFEVRLRALKHRPKLRPGELR
jgi:hypothetical protein